jgi:primosomal protein N' (replication factor Y)
MAMTDRHSLLLAAFRILRAPYAIDRDFDYRVPDYMKDRVKRGSLVTVPFGRSNRRETAICMSVREIFEDEAPKALKIRALRRVQPILARLA